MLALVKKDHETMQATYAKFDTEGNTYVYISQRTCFGSIILAIKYV